MAKLSWRVDQDFQVPLLSYVDDDFSCEIHPFRWTNHVKFHAGDEVSGERKPRQVWLN
jgi:hypothetical protein